MSLALLSIIITYSTFVMNIAILVALRTMWRFICCCFRGTENQKAVDKAGPTMKDYVPKDVKQNSRKVAYFSMHEHLANEEPVLAQDSSLNLEPKQKRSIPLIYKPWVAQNCCVLANESSSEESSFKPLIRCFWVRATNFLYTDIFMSPRVTKKRSDNSLPLEVARGLTPSKPIPFFVREYDPNDDFSGIPCADELPTLAEKYNFETPLFKKLCVWNGDITKLKVDTIVNAANDRLAGGAGVDGAIHDAAGYPNLQRECRKIGRCDIGSAVITSACLLRHSIGIIHAVGPRTFRYPTAKHSEQLSSCYRAALQLAIKYKLKTIAFPCIATGLYGYPHAEAAKVVLRTLQDFFNGEAGSEIDRVVLCLFVPADIKCYNEEVKRLADLAHKRPSSIDDDASHNKKLRKANDQKDAR